MAIQWRIQNFLLEKPTFYVVSTSSNKLRSEEHFGIRGRIKRRGWGVVPKSYQWNHRQQWSCGKVMFLHLSVILFTGVSLPRGDLYPGGSLSRGSLSRGSVSRGSLSRGSLSGRPPIQLHVGGTHPNGMHSCCIRKHFAHYKTRYANKKPTHRLLLIVAH